MKTLSMIGALLPMLVACAVERVELFPDGGGVASVDAVGPREDAGPAADDAAADDAAADDAAADDAAADDAAAPDAAADDAAAPDAAPTTCTCRFPLCRTDPDCEARIGPGSTCSALYCSGARGSCQFDRDCPTNFVCTTAADSTTRCP